MSQWIKSGVVDQFIYFDAPPSLSNFVVYGSLDGAAAASFTTPTVNETDATNMPGVYELLLDEQTTIAVGNTTEILKLYISADGWAGKSIDLVLFNYLPVDVKKVAGGPDIKRDGTGNQKYGEE